MHKDVSFPLIKAWFHRIFQESRKRGSFICRRFRGLASAQDRILFLYMQWVTLLILQVSSLSHHPELTGTWAAQPSPDAGNKLGHCWEHIGTEARWQGEKATRCPSTATETSPSAVSLALLISYTFAPPHLQNLGIKQRAQRFSRFI